MSIPSRDIGTFLFMTRARFDEINNLIDGFTEELAKGEKTIQEAEDDFFDYLVYLYLTGFGDVNEYLALETQINDEKMLQTIYRDIGGENCFNRLVKAVGNENRVSNEDIKRIIDTEFHRIYNSGTYDSAVASGVPLKKRWATMEDLKVRDTHFYLEGVEKDLTDYFYTFDGDKALYPTDFETAQNNVNCRCWIEIVKQ